MEFAYWVKFWVKLKTKVPGSGVRMVANGGDCSRGGATYVTPECVQVIAIHPEKKKKKRV